MRASVTSAHHPPLPLRGLTTCVLYSPTVIAPGALPSSVAMAAAICRRETRKQSRGKVARLPRLRGECFAALRALPSVGAPGTHRGIGDDGADLIIGGLCSTETTGEGHVSAASTRSKMRDADVANASAAGARRHAGRKSRQPRRVGAPDGAKRSRGACLAAATKCRIRGSRGHLLESSIHGGLDCTRAALPRLRGGS